MGYPGDGVWGTVRTLVGTRGMGPVMGLAVFCRVFGCFSGIWQCFG